MRLETGNRVIDDKGHAATLIRFLDPNHPVVAMIRYDYQRPSSDPKPKPISLLTKVSD